MRYAVRARCLPLIITELPNDVDQWNRDELTRHLLRARIFAYHGSPAALRRMITILSRNFSILQDLSLVVDGLAISTLPLPSAIIRNAASTLKRIYLRHVSILWSVLPVNLRHLDVSAAIDDAVFEILEGLRAAPQLEVLCIHGLQPQMVAMPLEQPLVLQHLRNFVLSGHVSSVAALCSSITPHPTASLDWSTCTIDVDDGDAVNRMLETLSSLCSQPERPICHEAKIACYDTGFLDFTLSPIHHDLIESMSIPPSDSEGRAVIHILLDDPYGVEHEHARTLSRLYRAHWKTLEVTGGTTWDNERIIDCFGQAKALEVLSLKDHGAHDAGSFFFLLNPDYMAFEGASEVLFFPGLHTLSVSGVHFGCSEDKCDDPNALGPALDATLKYRKEAGHMLSLLIVKACSVAFNDVWNWRHDGQCTTVEWDDDEGEAHSHFSDSEDEEDGASDEAEGLVDSG